MRRYAVMALIPVLLSARIAIEHVTVVDPRSGAVLPDTTVLISGSKIHAMGASAATAVPRGYRRVDARHKYLIPGLWDCHVHLTKAEASSLPLLVANGVTSVRDMGSDPAEVLQWRREITEGRRIGPSIKTAGRILESTENVHRMLKEGTVEPVARIRQPVGNIEEAYSAVAQLKREGVDHLKVRTVANSAVFDALVRAATAAGLPLTGHPVAPPAELFGRMRSIEHLLSSSPLAASKEERDRLFKTMRDTGTWMSTTLVNFEGSILVPYQRARAIVADKRLKYIGPALLADWREQIEERKDAKDYLDFARGLLPLLLRDVREMHDAGVKLLPGTDLGVALMYPGFTLHDELAIYVKDLKFSPMETLRMATHNPAEFYAMEKESGGIAPGQTADLVLLNRNPLTDIANTQCIQAVILQGNLFDRKRISRLLAGK